MIKKREIDSFDTKLEDRKEFIAAVKELKELNIIDYEALKGYEKENLFEAIWLVLTDDSLLKAYNKAKRIPLLEKINTLITLPTSYHFEKEELSSFINKQVIDIKTKLKITRFFTLEAQLNEDIFKALVFMDQNRDETLERVLSTSLYHDSKRFERVVKAKVVSILKAIFKENYEEGLSEEQLLTEYGIVSYPEIFEFCGLIKLTIRGCVIDYSSLLSGAYLNGEDAKELTCCTSSCRRVLFIENKANYIAYIKTKREDELVVYHGGFFSPMKKLFFTQLYKGLTKLEFYHWSDIDLGGFRLFTRLKKEIIPTLKPYKMDKQTLLLNKALLISITDNSYLLMLEQLLALKECEVFYDLINTMLTLKVKMEQESLLL